MKTERKSPSGMARPFDDSKAETIPLSTEQADPARTAYQASAFARMGIPFERAMQSPTVRAMLAGAPRLKQSKPEPKAATGNR